MLHPGHFSGEERERGRERARVGRREGGRGEEERVREESIIHTCIKKHTPCVYTYIQ